MNIKIYPWPWTESGIGFRICSVKMAELELIGLYIECGYNNLFNLSY